MPTFSRRKRVERIFLSEVNLDEMRLALLATALILAQSAAPKCSWMCDDPVCEAVCKPVCQQPSCVFSLASCPLPPSCAADCTNAVYDGLTCPECATRCAPSTCANASIACEPPQCSWDCVKPKTCRRPVCELSCEKPTCSSNTTHPEPVYALRTGCPSAWRNASVVAVVAILASVQLLLGLVALLTMFSKNRGRRLEARYS